jgi:hypothetical protein
VNVEAEAFVGACPPNCAGAFENPKLGAETVLEPAFPKGVGAEAVAEPPFPKGVGADPKGVTGVAGLKVEDDEACPNEDDGKPEPDWLNPEPCPNEAPDEPKPVLAGCWAKGAGADPACAKADGAAVEGV